MTPPEPRDEEAAGASGMFRPVDVRSEPDGRMAKRGALAFVGVALQGAVRFLSSFLVGRLTSPASLAVVSSGMSLANLFSLAWPTSTGAAASRFVARARGQGERGDPAAVAHFLGLRLIQSVVVLALAVAPAWVLLGGSWGEALIIAVLVAGYSGYAYTRGVHFGAGQADRQIKWDLLTSSIGVFGVVVVLVIGAPPILVLLALGSAYLLYTAACWPWSARGYVDRETRREIDAFVAWGSLGTLASAGFVQFAMITAVVVAGHGDAGLFAAAMTLAAPAAMVANSLSMVLFPSMAEAFGRGDRRSLEMQLDRSTRLLSVLLVCIFGLLVIGARPLVVIVWGQDYAGTAGLLPLLLVPGMLRSLAAPSQGAISTTTSEGIVFSSVASVVGFVVGGTLWLFMPSSWGVTGVAVGYALGTTLIALAIYVKAWRDQHQEWWGMSLRLALVTVGMSALSLVLGRLGLSMVYDVALALVFVAGWLLWVRTDAASALRLLSRRVSSD